MQRKVPTKLDDLMGIKGIGRKSGVLLRNECFRFFSGIGPDKHVFKICMALGFLQPLQGRNLTVHHAEASLQEWIAVQHYKDCNNVFGGIAQVFIQDFEKVEPGEKLIRAGKLARAISACLQSDHQVELIWFIIAKVRFHYLVVNKEKKKELVR
jgi:hypothetical protein